MEPALAQAARGRVARIRAVGPVLIRVVPPVLADIWVVDPVAALTCQAVQDLRATCPAVVVADTRAVALTAKDERVVF
jgi:hypothetical protein